MNDYLTLVKTRKPCNKHVYYDSNGELAKDPGPPIYAGVCRTVHVPDVAAMTQLLEQVADDPRAVLLQGYFPGTTNGHEFRLTTGMKVEKLTGTKTGWATIDGKRAIARLKDNMLPSSWVLFDRDYADGIPADLAALDSEAWEAALSELLPGFDLAGWVRVGSTSRRVLVDGAPLDSNGTHYWAQGQAAHDPAFGPRLLAQAAVRGYGFHKVNKKGAKTLWSIFDPTVFSHERVVYAGCPTVEGEGLSIAPPNIEGFEGPRIDTRLTPDLTPDEEAQLYKQFKLKMARSGRVGSLEALVDDQQLQLDTEVETAEGAITVKDFYARYKDKLRCQATFRESSSWNGFLSFDGAGMPFLYDNGTHTRYTLGDKCRSRLMVKALRKVLQKRPSRLQRDVSLRMLAELRADNPEAYAELRAEMKATKGVEITPLERKLNRIKSDSSPAPIDLARATARTIGSGSLMHRDGSFWYWDEAQPGCWRRLGSPEWLKQRIHDTMERVLGKNWNSASVEDVFRILGPECFNRVEMDRNPHVINVANGELSFVGGEWQLGQHRRTDFATVCLPAEYRPTAKAPRFDTFLGEVFEGDASKRELLLQMMGYTLLRHCHHEKMLLLIGKGSNGKSVVLVLMEALCGKENIAGVQTRNLGEKFQRAHLEGKLLNLVTEISRGEKLPDGDVKALVSGESASVEHKYKDPHMLAPFATLWFAMNDLPVLRDFSDAIRRRTFLLEFNRKFEEGVDADIGLKEYLVKNEVPGVLNMALAALGRLLTDGWVDCPASDTAVERWFHEADSVQWFADMRCHTNPDVVTALSTLYEAYTIWGEQFCITPVGGREFGRRMRSIAGSEQQKGAGGAAVIRGVCLQPLKVPVAVAE